MTFDVWPSLDDPENVKTFALITDGAGSPGKIWFTSETIQISRACELVEVRMNTSINRQNQSVRILALFVVLGIISVENNASAGEPGPMLAIAPSYSSSLGRFSGSYDQGSVQQTNLNFQLGGYISPRLAVAIYFGGGWKGEGQKEPPITCRGMESVCSSLSLRVGLGAEYRMAPGAALSPWVFLGAGILRQAFEHSARTSRIEYLGTEARLMVGADFAASPAASFAPFISVVPTWYELIISPSGNHKIQDIRAHLVFELGLRLTLTLPRNPHEAK